MKKFIWAMNLYGVGCPIALWTAGTSGISWLIYVSTLALMYCLAVGCDAVYDSLAEQTQSVGEMPPSPVID
jgi:hypothetical protein